MPTTDAAAMSHARTLASATPTIPTELTTNDRQPTIGNAFHRIHVFHDPPVGNVNPWADLTAADQSRDLADNECRHGHLASDARITCDCYELARIRRAAEMVDAAELDDADELLELAADPAPTADLERRPHRAELDPWQTDPTDRDYLDPAERWCRVCKAHPSDPIHEEAATS
jgi:hypothetical protein